MTTATRNLLLKEYLFGKVGLSPTPEQSVILD